VEGATALARFVFFVAASVAFGTAVFPLYAWRTVEDRDAAWVRALVLASAAAALISAVAWLALSIRDFGGEDWSSFVTTGQTVLFETAFGPAWLVRLVAAVTLIGMAAVWPHLFLLLGCATILLGSEAWLGHAAVGGIGHRISQLLHLFSAGAWLGGLPTLARALADGARRPIAAERARRILFRFSAMGIVAVTVIALTGVVNRLYVAAPTPVLASDYDRLFGLKVVLFLAMVAVAVFNRFGLVPRLAVAEARPATLRQFWWTVFFEQCLGLSLLVVASFLGMTSPPE
jgi:putative copper resistance protein D